MNIDPGDGSDLYEIAGHRDLQGLRGLMPPMDPMPDEVEAVVMQDAAPPRHWPPTTAGGNEVTRPVLARNPLVGIFRRFPILAA
jgi:hypothetical protein